jgi:serine O-acetyltransferase
VSARSFLALIRSDVEAGTHPNFRLYSQRVFWTRAIGKLLASPGIRAVIAFRVSHALAARGLMPFAMLLRARILRRSGAEIHPRATIGPGLFLVHSSGVVIGPDVVIGARCRIHQGATLGEPVHVGDGVWRAPRVGDDVKIGAHAVVFGDVQVGDRAVIGANSVVTKDVAAGTTVAGVPARELPGSR